ncbi:MAG: FAD:protein FMN transferase [Dehalococcoidia bacterium]|nr:MAG: FAD:protein FMN transferase [Dehalococcoidia bacterium]
MKRAYQVIAGLLILFIVVLGSTTCSAQPISKFEETRSLMDTYVKIIVYTDADTAEAALNAAFTRMEEIEQIASIYDSESEAFQLNQNGYLENPSEDLFQLMTLSLDYYELTDGNFNIAVQPLLELWQGGLWKESPEVQQIKIDETLALVDLANIAIAENRIDFQKEGMEITLGGIAKGYAVDEALAVLSQMGIEHALLDAGGDMAAIGAKPESELWNVALVNPDDTSQSLAAFQFADKAVATSGNYQRYFNPEKTAHHIINPKTGFSAGECLSVTIIAGSGTQADVLATSVFVMGPIEGMKLVESLDGVECLIVDTERNIHRSSGLSSYLM